MLKSRLDLLVRNGRAGFALVFLVLALFLRFRLAVWVSIGIPISFLGALALMPSLDVSVNLISLFAFIVVLGIVVDDAIVVGENIYTHQQRRQNGRRGAIEGAREVAVPVVWPAGMGGRFKGCYDLCAESFLPFVATGTGGAGGQGEPVPCDGPDDPKLAALIAPKFRPNWSRASDWRARPARPSSANPTPKAT